MDITIRLAVPADAPAMAEVHMRSWEIAYKDIIPADYIREKNATRPALYARIITDENTTHYVIEAGGRIIGIMSVALPEDNDLDDSVYELNAIYLHPDYYRQGIGTQAMAFAMDKARRLGKTAMVVWVLADNANSIRFYQKCGYAPDGATDIIQYGKALVSIRMRRNL